MGIFQQATLTNLRNLRYGRDTIGGGDSGAPYITTSIPAALGQQGDPDPIIDASINGVNIIQYPFFNGRGYNSLTCGTSLCR